MITEAMPGFDGDPARLERLHRALETLLDVFPRHLAKAQPPAPFEAPELLRNAQFDAILRAHKKERLTIPVQALRAAGAPYHGFSGMTARRLAWFVPSLLASWLVRAPGAEGAPFGPQDIEALVGPCVEDGAPWTDGEREALDACFAALLDAALATPLRPPHPAVGDERPREDGVRVWSQCSPSVPLEVLRVARALGLALEPLVARWTAIDTPLALDHLLEAVFDTTIASKHYVSDEAVAERLGEAFFAANGERQTRLAKAEATVRRNIARRRKELGYE